MKQKFSNKWVGSKQPRKQRKYLANAPIHIKHKMMSSNLSKELRKKYGRRSFTIRKDDNVKVMRGEFKGKKGKIEAVDPSKSRVIIAGVFRNKKDGSKVNVYFNPSNLQIQELNLDDIKRKESLERKSKKSKEETEIKKEDTEKNKNKQEKK